ncbi:MAG: septation protein A [Gammaproteobacteria bacterium]|nr:septation protein A [Gammaproteobacteria bacterium]MDD9874392.1 septation protein A [Gammaproteobacteria bacterium]
MKLLFDFLPLLIFFAAFKFYDIYTATAAAIAATVVQVGVFWARHRRFETAHLVTLAVIAVFGGLTIALRDELFIKWKPSIVNWIFAAAVLGSLGVGRKSALEYLMGNQISLAAAVWRKLNIAWGAFFLLMGLLNLYVAFYHNAGADEQIRTQTWVNFKVFGLTGLTLLFLILQTVFLARHITPEEDN